jgi:hypothetical protein
VPWVGFGGVGLEGVAGDPSQGEVAQAPANALMLRRLLAAADASVA